ncbi:hypothetical protein LY90DRAFT_511580 [Neocallimastix californiae]|uniref:Uncharacterized protein n=1 Tax=Neocallimastix californiae TaxID=1754190 RepID=A0A1Y2BPY5_9FUNG|nr:hypothetical protein LY90DRAFT_511580 [Neocallimastix californiae]|eukprot:ORY36235.1 hypothetical protein LY90DRAFT_511580 [Neocallimastix californiae]
MNDSNESLFLSFELLPSQFNESEKENILSSNNIKEKSNFINNIIIKLINRNEELSGQDEIIKNNLDYYIEENKSKDDLVNKLTQEIEEEEHQKEVKEHKEANNNKASKIEELQHDNKILEQKCENAEKDFEDYKKNINIKHEEDKKNLKKAYINIYIELDESQQDNNNFRNENEYLDKTYKSLKQKCENTKEHEKEVKDLKEASNNKASKIAKLQQDNKNLKQNNKNIKQKCKNSEKELEDYKKNINNKYSTDIEQIKKEHEKEINGLKEVNNNLFNESKDSQHDKVFLKQKIENLQQNTKYLIRENENLK